ncbi:hypothetical protein [Hymenobacter daecheongensis]|uniref:hypothetical protein n=1 Tax=Hymenobacter daecheongensis TaxID=496053 RepID=UPI00116121F1|nr:hypothetical protein [Hymenobacter daecheongensis]
MKITVEVVWFAEGLKARLYSVRLPGQTAPETVRFFNRMSAHPSYESDTRFASALRTLLDWLDRIIRLEGALLRFFRPGEGQGHALPIDKGPLRLYCYRLDDRNLLVCGGGIKASQTVQESPDCLPHFNLMNCVVKALRRRHIGPERLPQDASQAYLLEIEIPDDEHPG